MNSRRRYLRPLALFILMALFSLSLFGRIDSRMNIGGFDWEEEQIKQSSVPIENAPQAVSASENENNQQNLATANSDDTANSTVSNNTAVASVPTLSQAVSGSATEEAVVSSQKVVKVDASQIPQPQVPQPDEAREKPTVLVHTVRAGETLWDIAKAYGITVEQIASANNIVNTNKISVGQKLNILTVKGVLHEVAYGETLSEIAQRYGVPLAEIISVNKITDPSKIQTGTQIVIPGATQLLKKDVLVINGQLQKAFSWPAKARISSNFGQRWGRMHYGIDIAVVTGTPVKAAADGVVTFAGTNGGYGILVTIDHGNGVETRYAHNSRVAVKVGQQVKRGDIIAYSGNTGNSTGPHLHFEIRYKGTAVDPLPYLKD